MLFLPARSRPIESLNLRGNSYLALCPREGSERHVTLDPQSKALCCWCSRQFVLSRQFRKNPGRASRLRIAEGKWHKVPDSREHTRSPRRIPLRLELGFGTTD